MINKKPLINFIIWLLLGILICFVGITNAFALTTKTIYSDLALSNSNKYNYGYTNAGGIDDVTTGTVGSRINGKTKYIGFYLNETTILNYTYTIRINFLSDDLQPYFSLNYVRRIETCNSSSCSNASIVAIRKQNNNGYSTWVELDFNPTQVGSKIGVVLGNDNGNYITGETYFGISSVQIESKNANQDVINNATNNTNNIINNNNSNTENIINNNDENTQKIIDENKKNFQTCRDSINLFNTTLISGVTVYDSGVYYPNSYRLTTNDWILLDSGTYTISLKSNYNIKIALVTFTNNDEFYNLSGYSGVWNNQPLTFTLNQKTKLKLNLSINASNTNISVSDIQNFQLQEGSVATDYEPYGEEICVNKLDEQKNAIDNVDNTLKDDNVDDNGVADAFEEFNDFLDDNSTITQLITLPITLYTAILNNVNGSCQSFNLGKLYGEDLILPCINISQYLGNSLWTMIDVIISGFAIFAISKKMIKVFNNFSSLREGDVIDD